MGGIPDIVTESRTEESPSRIYKDAQCTFSLTSEELRRLRVDAEQAGVSLSAHVRACLFAGIPTQPRADLRRAALELLAESQDPAARAARKLVEKL